MKIKFKINLRRWLEDHRWKPKELADELKVSRQTIHHWMDGTSLPKNEEIIKKLYKLGGDKLIEFDNRSDKPVVPKPRAYFEVEGGAELSGTIRVSGAKNAALPMICAALLTPEKCIFENVPNITDIHNLLDIFRDIGVGVETDWEKNSVSVQAESVDIAALAVSDKAMKFRASLLMLGPLLSRFGRCELMQPGGCVIGARPNFIHTEGLKQLGAEEVLVPDRLSFVYDQKCLKNPKLLLSEASVTGTENLAMFLAGKAEPSEIFFAAAEPHVTATLKMLSLMGACIEGIGTHHLKINGSQKLKGGIFKIPPDGILAGTYTILGLLTNSAITVENVDHKELLSFYGLIKRMGASFEMLKNKIKIEKSGSLQAIPKVHTAIYPGFSTDLQSPMGVLLTQCEGETMIYETLFENRLSYLFELEKMGAQIQIINAHQAKVIGKTALRGTEVQSWDLRAGAAMVLAGLIAEGTTKVTNIDYIDRGYENFVENLTSLGAQITRVE